MREEKETDKFHKASENIYKIFVKAENNVIFNAPLMMFTVYTCIILLSWFGAKMIVVDSLTTGELMSLYCILYEYFDEPDDAVYGICYDLYEYRRHPAYL